MKAVIQRVISASVKADGNLSGHIENGLLIFLGIGVTDTAKEAQLLALKTSKLRVFSDSDGKMNLSVLDIGAGVLVVSQFTLMANCRKGNRPSFSLSAQPSLASDLYKIYIEELKNSGVQNVEQGVFGADMKVELINDGPVTIIYDTKEWEK
ncbi:MAG: D-tyrosyl-tRNA(Tyr) deacylase [Oscillospiraceae bacterium]|jgi:D-tyrosyl-tRNA(Tyr) deacylase|nr:D-tyrosyl-tRNA(Tyr) deacylase [Oscillospiraceae bacterium]